MHYLRDILRTFLAGAFGGLVNSVFVWGFGALGLTPLLGANITPALTMGWLLPRLFYGGLWGFLFLLPVLGARPYLKGLVLSIGPTLYMLFVVFPRLDKGAMGLALGPTTPIFVVFFNAIWGLAAAWWLLRVMRGRV